MRGMNAPAPFKTCLLALLLGGASPSLPAKDMDGEFAVFGLGATRCGDYLQARRGNVAATRRYADWTLAYVSAFNLIVPNTYDLMGDYTLDQALDWLDEHCGGNPEQVYINAVAALGQSLFPSRNNIAPGKDNRAKWAEEVISGGD